jgi:hypothetical protein
MAVGEGMQGGEANDYTRRRGARTTLGRGRKRRRRRALSAEVKTRLAPPVLIDPRSHAPRIARFAHINCRRAARSLTGGTHHDRSTQAHACARSLRCGNRSAAAGHHVRPPTSPTTRAAAAPEKARPLRIYVAATVGIKWLGPLPSKDDHRAARVRGSKKPDPRRVQLPTSGLETRSAGAGATGALNLQRLLISGLRAGPAASPRVLKMQKVEGTQLPPRSGPTDEGFGA